MIGSASRLPWCKPVQPWLTCWLESPADLQKPLRTEVLDRGIDRLNTALDVLNKHEPDAVPLVQRGVRFTCTHGHFIATAPRDIFKSDIVGAEMFSDLQGPPVRSGDSIGICRCGARWAFKSAIHIEHGWTSSPLSHHAEEVVAADELTHVLRHGQQLQASA